MFLFKHTSGNAVRKLAVRQHAFHLPWTCLLQALILMLCVSKHVQSRLALHVLFMWNTCPESQVLISKMQGTTSKGCWNK